MKLHLVDIDADLVKAWTRCFGAYPEVEVRRGDLLAVARGCLISPANSFGFMDGGIDAAYARYFGPLLERRVRETIARRPEKFLPVGAAEVVATGDPRIPYLILAPTMSMPEQVPASHAYRAFKAALRAACAAERQITEIFCPGLGTGVGGIAPEDAAVEMASAYRDWLTPR